MTRTTSMIVKELDLLNEEYEYYKHDFMFNSTDCSICLTFYTR